MSGVEIVGVVLGSIPLIVKAFEHYAEGVKSVRRLFHYKWELKSYSLALRTEFCLFQNVLTWLLSGITTADKVEILISGSGVAWSDKELVTALRDRLGKSYGVFLDLTLDMRDALGSFQKRLGLDDDGQVSLELSNHPIAALDCI
jgi:hypothetical protein